jgi:hypothetical protein
VDLRVIDDDPLGRLDAAVVVPVVAVVVVEDEGDAHENAVQIGISREGIEVNVRDGVGWVETRTEAFLDGFSFSLLSAQAQYEQNRFWFPL